MSAAMELQTLSSEQLDTVGGGTGAARVAGRVLRKVGSKLIPGVNVASTIYDTYEGVQGFNRARQQGHGVARSTWEGVRSFAGFGSE